MIEDAEMFQVQDEEKQGSLKKKSELETYLYKVNKMLRKSEIKKSMPKEMRDALRGEIGDILDWIEENPEEKPAVQEESKESKDPVSGISLSPKKKKLAPAELVIMCVSGSRLHIWPLPDLPSLKQGTKSLCIDLAVFVPGLSIEDVAFLDGFDKEGRIVGVAGAGGVVLILNCRKQELLWKVPAGKGVFGSWTARTRPTCTA